MSDQRDVFEMQDVLKKTLQLVEKSINSGWPDEEPSECAKVLIGMIAFVDDPQRNVCPEYAGIQFLPTGPIQEIAMANGWHDDYLELAERYDEGEKKGHFFT